MKLAMINVKVFVKNISAENFWQIGKTVPPIKIATNLNIVGINKKDKNLLEVPFVFNINYNPLVAQISLKGTSHVIGQEKELEKIIKEHTEKKAPPSVILQSISNVVFLESIFLCKTLNIPPPIPLPKIPIGTQKKRSEPTYRA
jgi:hypothetical protein